MPDQFPVHAPGFGQALKNIVPVKILGNNDQINVAVGIMTALRGGAEKHNLFRSDAAGF
ncbi:MAG: hypothetical protein NTW95_06550 [Candidatus Aminicenantes bacterium]|nr:hypothetical protein [Candidatus Aminicenantes bacterium]